MGTDNDPSAMNITLSYPSHPSYSPNGGFIAETAFNGNTAFTFTSFIEETAIKPTRGRKPGPKAKIKNETTPGQLVFEHSPAFSISRPPSAESATAQYGDSVPAYMTQELQLQVPTVAKGRGRGRGRGRTTDFDIEPPDPPKLGKGRAATQGVVIQIPHQGREEALADQARKRRRVDADEDLGDQDEILQRLLTSEEAKELPLKKRKTEPKSKRDHHACDRCFRNKTKCHRQIDGKPPGKSFPCDYCTNIHGICTSAVADAKKPESYTIAEETQWKNWKFKDIITKAMEDENLRLRKENANFEEKFCNQERTHAAVKSTLDTVQAHNQTQKKALENAEKLAAVQASEVSKLKKLLRAAYRQNDLLKRNMGLKQGNQLKVPEPETEVASIAPSVSIGRAWAFGGEDNEKPLTVVDQRIKELQTDKKIDHESQASIKKSEEANRQDVLQGFRQRGLECNEQTQLNEYVKAYFANVHPLLPVLHKDAFLALYRLHGNKAPASQIDNGLDASTADGQVVSLICAVLALGALSLVETRNFSQQRAEAPDLARLPHFGEAMGFYAVCVRILSYTHDTLETMITFLLMSVFAIQTTDIKEAFRRLYQFQAQAIALKPGQMFNEEDTELSAFYNQDIWPGVTNLVVSEMVKRSWTMFKVYLSHVAMELGRPTTFTVVDISPPTVVDDEYLGFDATSIEDYRKVPNPIRFILVLGDLARIVDAYSKIVWLPSEITRQAQIAKFREIWEDLSQWRSNLPAYLDWEKPNKGLSSHGYLKVQRPYLETQYWCVRMKLGWSIAHLDPVLMAKFQSIWDMDGNIYQESLKAGQNALKVIEDTILQDEGSNQTQMYHWEAVRATTTLLQFLLRNEIHEVQMTSDKLVETCQKGVAVCRKLVPFYLTNIENVLGTAINQYIDRHSRDQEHLQSQNPELSLFHADHETSLVTEMAADNMNLEFLHNFDEYILDSQLGSHQDLGMLTSTEPFGEFLHGFP